ncbi:hypothetical protein [Arenibacter certesii]|uniref:Prenyltransferase n=1 Tax=Arenibacter certesii TaxID=228955 RepID=A0A918MGT1_9FLAO|nr:hypothetical protein [Arenibacter certesii]GGW24023.1 hypothetical protein GCM10007383_05650 [Arenibacter certesii]
MYYLKRLFDFYLDSSIHTALAVFALIEVTGIFFGITRDHNFSYLVFFGTIVCYNFVKYGVEARKYILVSNTYHGYIQIVSFLAGAMALYHAFYITLNVWMGIGFLLLLTFLYAIPLLPRVKSLRSLGGLKIFVVALVWAGTTVILPVMSENLHLGWDVVIEGIQRFVLVLVLMIPFEIRDLKYDDRALNTLPQRYGLLNSKLMGGFGALLFFLFTFIKMHTTHLELLAKGIVLLVLWVILYRTKKMQSKYFSSFWVEGIPILWWGVVLLLERFLLSFG